MINILQLLLSKCFLRKSSQRDVAVICTRKATEQRKQAQQLLMDAMTGKEGVNKQTAERRLAAGLFSINEYCLASVLCCYICEVFVDSLVKFETLKIEKILKWRATKAQNNVKNNLIFKAFKRHLVFVARKSKLHEKKSSITTFKFLQTAENMSGQSSSLKVSDQSISQL